MLASPRSTKCLSPQCACCQRSDVLARINEELLGHKDQLEERNHGLSEEIQVSRRFYQGTLADLTAQLSIGNRKLTLFVFYLTKRGNTVRKLMLVSFFILFVLHPSLQLFYWPASWQAGQYYSTGFRLVRNCLTTGQYYSYGLPRRAVSTALRNRVIVLFKYFGHGHDTYIHFGFLSV